MPSAGRQRFGDGATAALGRRKVRRLPPNVWPKMANKAGKSSALTMAAVEHHEPLRAIGLALPHTLIGIKLSALTRYCWRGKQGQ